MGNSPSKKPNNPFERGKEEAQRRIEEFKENADPKNKRVGRLVPPGVMIAPHRVVAGHNSGAVMPSAPPEPLTPTGPFDPYAPTAPPEPNAAPSAPMEPSSPDSSKHISSYDKELLAHMKYQLDHDANAFLLNNILLSVQFLENYEREVLQVKETPSKEENLINEAMFRYNKHVIFADRLLERVSEHVNYQRSQGQLEALASPKLYIIHDNVETRVAGDTSNYSSTLDAPFYKLQLEDCKKLGFMKLKRLEVLKNNFYKKTTIDVVKDTPDNGISSDIESELDDTDEKIFVPEDSPLNLDPKTDKSVNSFETHSVSTSSILDIPSTSGQVIKHNELRNRLYLSQNSIEQTEAKPKKSILKPITTTGTKYLKSKDRHLHHNQNYYIEESSATGSSGYSSILSGGSAPSEFAVPKRIELLANYSSSSGVLSDECWTVVLKNKDKNKKQADAMPINADYNLSDEEDDTTIDTAYEERHERLYYLDSPKFMNAFIVNFKQDLGLALGFSQVSIRNAMTHAATIYCDSFKDFLKKGYEIIPGLTAPWPNAANPWIIRERKTVQNPRNNYKYKWPEPNMINRASDFGCLLVPIGQKPKEKSNPKEKINPEKNLKWKITFPESERYLENLLAHSQIRCYLFTLLLHKTFLDNDMLVGIDSSHIKNHLFWQCEDNFARWPEDRLGESLTSFLESFYKQFSKARLPNYFIDSCNEFENIPASVLLLLQWKLKDIIEAPVVHMLYAIDKLKYNSIGFYPTFDSQKLFEILTCKNPLNRSSPNLAAVASNNQEYSRKPKRKIRTSIKFPKKLGMERRHGVLKFFIPHFIAMARSSEKFDDINQAMIYLEQAQRLSLLLLDQPGGDSTADDYLEVIRDKLTDCQTKIINRGRFKISPRPEIRNNYAHKNIKQNPKIERGVSQDSLISDNSIQPITIADIHVELQDNSVTENHKTPFSTIADVSVEKQEEEKEKPKPKHYGTYIATKTDVHIEKEQNKVNVTKDKSEKKLVNHKISSGTVADVYIEKREESNAEHYGTCIITTADVHLEAEQNKDNATKRRSEKQSVKASSDNYKQERHIQLLDSVVEETYL